MSPMEPRRGRGRFQWNAGGWFGSQIGGTAWLLPLIVFLTAEGSAAAVAALVCFVVSNLVGWRLWRNRDRLDPYAAVQTLIAVMGGCAAIALLAAGSALSEVSGDRVSWALLVFPAVMAQFHFQERAARRRAATRQDT